MSRQIQRRNVDEYLIQLRIATNPHLEPDQGKKFVEGLLEQRAKLHDIDPAPQIDTEQLDLLKNRLRNESKMVKVS